MSSFSFTGRVIQVVESLDYGDAVSNHVIALDRMLKESGLTSLIAVQWMHEKVSHRCFHLSRVEPTDRDVVIFHFSGHSEYAAPYVLGCNATRVMQYHNITPQEFFADGSDLHRFCRDGRRQLKEIIPRFHAYWGDSQYNLDELFALGAPAKWAHVVPIIIPKPAHVSTVAKEAGSWLFVGRIAANKGQVKLVEAFTEAWRRDPASAVRLDLVGGYDVNHEYYHELLHAVEASPARDRIFVTGKVSDADRDAYLARASLYVSFSEHEGFGAPLVEASLHATPVLALGRAAVPETLGGHGVAGSADEVAAMAVRAIREPEFLAALLERQLKNAKRFAWATVLARLRNALADLLPRNDQYASVSIIICTYNRRDMLERCLEYLALQTDPRFEVVVVDGPSTDGTGEMLSAWRHRVKLCENPKAHLAISRNLGARAAAGDVLVYIDDDAIPFADYVGTVLSEFNSRPLTTAALGGPVYYAGALRFQAEDIAFNRLAEARMGLPSKEIGRGEWKRSLIGTSTAFTRQHFDAVGGFDEQYDYFLDESDLTYRMQVAGNLVVYCPDLFLRHEFARSENRKGKHSFNWFSIVKNTAYFVALYSGLEGEQRDDYLRRRFQQERVGPIDEGLRSGELDKETHRELVDSVWSGMRQGLIDSRRGPLLPGVAERPGNFLPFEVSHDVERVGIDIKRIHVCIIAKEFPPFSGTGGIGTLYYHLASELLLLGHEVTLITPDDKAGRYDQGRFHIRYGPWSAGDFGSSAPSTEGNMLWSLSAARCMAEVHAERPVDIIECALWDTEGLAVALIEERRPPVVLRLVTPFEIAATANQWNVAPAIADQHIAAERAMIDHADAVVAISQSILDSVTTHHEVAPNERWSVSHCGVAPWPFFDVNSNYDTMSGDVAMTDFMARNSKILLFVGRLERRKGVDTLLAAAARFLDADAEAGLMLAGRDVEEWARQYAGIVPERLRERVFFAGHVDDDLREKLLARAYCLIFPSRYESFGLVPLEAFVHGTPVIAANAGAVPEVVPDGVAGLLFDPGSADDLAAKVLQLLRDGTLRERLSEGARRQVHVLSARNSAIRAVNLYAALLAGRRKAGL